MIRVRYLYFIAILLLDYYRVMMLKKQELNIEGYAFLEKEVKNSGDSGRVFVPIAWVGKKVAVVLLEPLAQPD